MSGDDRVSIEFNLNDRSTPRGTSGTGAAPLGPNPNPNPPPASPPPQASPQSSPRSPRESREEDIFQAILDELGGDESAARSAARTQSSREFDEYANSDFLGSFDEFLQQPEPEPDLFSQVQDGSLFSSLMGDGSNLVTSTVASGITSLTGSSSLGAIGGALGSNLLAGSAAAGPLSIAAVVASVVSEMNTMVAETINKGMAGIADGLTGDRVQAIAPFAEGAKSATYALDPIQALTGLNLSIGDDVLRGFIDAIQLATGNLEQMAEGMQRYSSDVASAFADRQLSQVETELYRDERFGGEMGAFVEANTQIQEDIERIKIGLIEFVLPILTDILEVIGFFTSSFADTAKGLGELKDWAKEKLEVAEGYLVQFGISPADAKAIVNAILWVIAPAAAYYLNRQKSQGGKMLQEVLTFLNPGTFARQVAQNPGAFR